MSLTHTEEADEFGSSLVVVLCVADCRCGPTATATTPTHLTRVEQKDDVDYNDDYLHDTCCCLLARLRITFAEVANVVAGATAVERVPEQTSANDSLPGCTAYLFVLRPIRRRRIFS